MIVSLLTLVYITAERIGELWLDRRNTRRLLARGGTEHAEPHYPLIVALHAMWLVGMWLLAWGRPPILFWLCIFGVLQIIRVWVMTTLKDRWTARIVTIPNEALVRHGPYRFIEHPNYAVVVGEVAVLPLVFGLWQFSLVFSVLNAAILFLRIGAENRALAPLRRA